MLNPARKRDANGPVVNERKEIQKEARARSFSGNENTQETTHEFHHAPKYQLVPTDNASDAAGD